MRFKEHQGRQIICARARRKRASALTRIFIVFAVTTPRIREYCTQRVGQTCISPSKNRVGKIPQEKISTLCTTKQSSFPFPLFSSIKLITLVRFVSPPGISSKFLPPEYALSDRLSDGAPAKSLAKSDRAEGTRYSLTERGRGCILMRASH